MPIIQTQHTFDGRKISYEILEKGYNILLGGYPWIGQHEPDIPYPELGYEGSCLKQIEDITKAPEPVSANLEERVTKLEQEKQELQNTLNALLGVE